MLYIVRRNKRETEPKLIKMHFSLPVRNGWSRDIRWSTVPHYSLSLATAEHLKHLLIMLCRQTICPSIAINRLWSCAFEELKTDTAGKVTSLSNEILSGIKQNFSSKKEKSFSIAFCSDLSGCAKALLRWPLSGFKLNWRRILFVFSSLFLHSLVLAFHPSDSILCNFTGWHSLIVCCSYRP